DRNPHDALGIERAFRTAQRVEIATTEPVHLDERTAILGGTGILPPHERGVTQRGGLAGLADEPSAELGILRKPLVDHLERDLALQDRMLGGIDRCDAANSEERADHILAGKGLSRAL